MRWNGKFAVAGAGIAALCLALSIYHAWSAGNVAALANDRIYICSETGKPFRVDLAKLQGSTIPIRSPYSGRDTGFPAELCYWTADGKMKPDPTPVLLNELKGNRGPTFCPDCGRLVIPHNPPAITNAKPPPTRQEWEKRQLSRGH